MDSTFSFLFLFYHYDCEDREIPNIFLLVLVLFALRFAQGYSQGYGHALFYLHFFGGGGEGNQWSPPVLVHQPKGPKEKKLGLGQHSTFAFIIIENYHNI